MSSYTIPSVLEATARGERVTDIFSRLLSERIVFVGTAVDDGVANVVMAQLLHLAAESPSDIQLYLNSPGGSFPAIMAIYDTMQFVAADVATLCVGQAAAASAILLAAGTKGKRSLLPHARVVLHQPHVAGSQGSLSDLALEAAETARIRSLTDDVLGRHTGHDASRIRSDTDRALVLTAEDAVGYGVADQIVERATTPQPSALRREQHRPSPLRPDS